MNWKVIWKFGKRESISSVMKAFIEVVLTTWRRTFRLEGLDTVDAVHKSSSVSVA